jgi:chemotaxis protein CheX
MVSDAEVREITLSVWETMLGLSLDDGPPAEAAAYVTGCVRISGGWQGTVTIEMSARLARTAAAALFSMAETNVTEAEVRDAVGELANVIGGNLKALMPGACQLSLPTVVAGRDHAFDPARGRMQARSPLACVLEPVRVTVFEETPEALAAGSARS